jgi:hypothetical protein
MKIDLLIPRASFFHFTAFATGCEQWKSLHSRQKSEADQDGAAYFKGDDIQYTPWLVWVVTCWRLHSWTSKMFMRITNLEGILHTPTCCECKQEIRPTVVLRLRPRIPILRIRICTGGPIRETDLQCTLVEGGIYKPSSVKKIRCIYPVTFLYYYHDFMTFLIIDYGCQVGYYLVSASCVENSNPAYLLFSNETEFILE